MQICECAKPQVRNSTTAPGQKVCLTCGHWWMPRHGSRRPPFNTITDADWKKQLATARSVPNAVVDQLRQAMAKLT